MKIELDELFFIICGELYDNNKLNKTHFYRTINNLKYTNEYIFECSYVNKNVQILLNKFQNIKVIKKDFNTIQIVYDNNYLDIPYKELLKTIVHYKQTFKSIFSKKGE